MHWCLQTAAALSAANHEAEAALALHANSIQAERRIHTSLHTLIEEKERVCNDYDARQGELEFELLTLQEDVGAQYARQSLQEAQVNSKHDSTLI